MLGKNCRSALPLEMWASVLTCHLRSTLHFRRQSSACPSTPW